MPTSTNSQARQIAEGPLAAASRRLRGPSSSRSASRSPAPGARQQLKAGLEPRIPATSAPRPLARETSGPALVPRLLGIEDAAVYLSLSSWTVRDMIAGGELRPVALQAAGKPVRRLLLDRLELDALVDQLTRS